MSTNTDQVREEMARDAEIGRGLGLQPTTDDLRYYGERMAYAALADNPPCYDLSEEEVLVETAFEADCVAACEPTQALRVVRFIEYVQNSGLA